MIDRLLDLLTGRAAPALKDSADQLQLAVAALLIEAGRMDGKFDVVERGTIERLLTERFHLEPQAVQSLIGEGRRKVMLPLRLASASEVRAVAARVPMQALRNA